MTKLHRIGCLMIEEYTPVVSESLWEALATHRPNVERSEGAGLFYLDVGDVASRYGDEASWCRAVLHEAHALGLAGARLGVAASKFAAWIAARTTAPSPGYQIAAVTDARFLAPLPLEGLPLSDDARRRLRLLGLETMGKLAALPQGAVAEQFGPEALTAWRWARGQDERPVLGRRCQTYTASHLFDAPEIRCQGLVATAAHLAERALADLPVDRRAWAIRRVTLTAHTVEGETLAHNAWLGETPGPHTLWALLERMTPHLTGEGGGIAELDVSLWGLEPAPGRQLTLPEAREAERQWRQVLCIMGSKYPDGLLRPVLADPQAPILTERYALQGWAV